MSEKILSQEEIDALLKGVATGVVETTPKEAEVPEAVTAFNFSGQDRVVRGRMAALDIIHDRFIKLLTATFTRALHRSIDIRIHRTEIVKFGTVMNQLPPSSLVIFKMDPLRGNALLAMDAALVYLLTDYYYGGVGQEHVKPEGRDFTPIQLRLIRYIGGLALQDLEKAWKGAHAIKAEVLRVESNPQFAMVITARELALVVTLQLEIGNSTKEFLLCYPYSMRTDQGEVVRRFYERPVRRGSSVGDSTAGRDPALPYGNCGRTGSSDDSCGGSHGVRDGRCGPPG